MEDSGIIELFFARSEQAITVLAEKYGKFCFKIAMNILSDREDSEECVNDTYFRVWNAVPPDKPAALGGYVGRITRNLAVSLYRTKHRQKRGGGEYALAVDELEQVIGGSGRTDKEAEERELTAAVNAFLAGREKNERIIFLMRYFALCPIDEIAGQTGQSTGKVKYSLKKTRRDLKRFLEKEELI
ncbi:MAG: sigma-70 family RNA polymerase sigma factor [Oscillospiraceae bacterium]|nr:sigma-70 family RNA polymerase sigma factor [Oscillospiraceae bacterium]